MTAKLKTPLCGRCDDGWVCDPETGMPLRRCPCRFALSPETERDTAIAAVTAARETQFKAACQIVADLAAEYATFSAEQARPLMTAAGIDARNVIGPAFLWAQSEDLIAATSATVRSTDAGTHSKRLTVWRSTAPTATGTGAA